MIKPRYRYLKRVCSSDEGATYLPRDCKLFVNSFGSEETVNVFLEGFLEFLLENDIFPVSLLNLRPKSMVLSPEALIIDPYLIVELIGPGANADEEGTSRVLRTWGIYSIQSLFT